ncbi:MAG: ABC transporter ATP-binding protein [Clostridia bacterium]|nr:ABC transporter ATP-binding protein [Clostridia bacterium]
MSNNDYRKTDAPDMSQRMMGGGGNMARQRAANLLAEKPKDMKGTIKRIFTYLKGSKVGMTTAIILLLVHTGLDLLTTYLLKPIVNDYIIPKNYQGLVKICVTLALLYVISGVFQYISNKMLIRISQTATHSMRSELFTKLQTLPVSYFDRNHFGDIMSRFTNDLENVALALKDTLAKLFQCVFNTVGTIGLMLWISPRLTVVSLFSIPVIYVVTGFITKHTKKYYRRYQADLATVNSYAEERISGQYVVTAFDRGEKVCGEFADYAETLRKNGIKAQFISSITMPALKGVNNIFYGFTVMYAGILALTRGLDLGGISAFLKYAKKFANPINEISHQIIAIQAAVAGAERVFMALDTESEYRDSEVLKPDTFRGDISIQNVDFSYTPERKILKNISVDVKQGQHIALVGPTGAGKTTIVNLLMRFYELDSGRITIDGNDIADIDRKTLRRNFGIVLQDTSLFTMSVADNIRFGKPEATMEEVVAAAKLAGADRFIRQLENGYETILSEGGGTLSGGQRQLLNIARAFLIDPPMLILDEATSNVDTRTELQIQSAMKTLMKGKTAFLIAHRLSTIRDCDMILVIDGGEIVERGNQEELVAMDGLYAKLYKGI